MIIRNTSEKAWCYTDLYHSIVPVYTKLFFIAVQDVAVASDISSGSASSSRILLVEDTGADILVVIEGSERNYRVIGTPKKVDIPLVSCIVIEFHLLLLAKFV